MKPNFKSGVLYGPNLMGCETGKTILKMNKPVNIGQAILDLSKTTMYEFHYDYMLLKYGDRILLCYMDMDSFIYEIETEDFFEGISDDVESRLDTSGYENDGSRPLLGGLNKKVIGLMKDELGGNIMREFVALRPKMYAYRVESEEFKRCKGIKKCVVKKDIKFEDYKRCLMTGDMEYRSQTMFRSRLHEITMIETYKLALAMALAMGTNCAPLLADFFLYSYENEFLDKLIKEGKRKLARKFNLSYRYIDDLISFNNKRFKEFISDIYPKELTIFETTESTSIASYLDLLFIRDNSNNITTKLYDKRDTFGFHIVNFPFMSSNIPSAQAYGVYASQLIRYARCCSNYSDFLSCHRAVVTRLLSQS